jgi:Na+/melibiose symporter-like transporter
MGQSMADWKTIRDARHERRAPRISLPLTLTALTFSAVVLVFFMEWFIPGAAVLPIFSLAAMTVAAAVALVAKMRGVRWDGDGVTLWDIAGASMLFGCAAAIFSKPENIPHWFGQSIVP